MVIKASRRRRQDGPGIKAALVAIYRERMGADAALDRRDRLGQRHVLITRSFSPRPHTGRAPIGFPLLDASR
jgi:hypothetical protein